MVIVGIDPGKKGAIVAIESETLHVLLVADMPIDKACGEVCPVLLYEIIKGIGPIDICVLEHPQAIFGKSNKTAMVSLGASYGIAKACAKLAQVKELITPLPSVWKRKMGATKEKEKSISLAKKLCPEIAEHLLKKRCRVESDDRAEACLLALYALKPV